jgi:DnaJ family protein C protein 9
MNAYEYYRALNPEIEKADFKNYISNYIESEEEATDLIKFYEDFGGDMKGILEHIIASTNDSIPRLLAFYEEKFKNGELEKTKIFD